MFAKDIRRIAKRETEKIMSSNLAGHQYKEDHSDICSEGDNSIDALFENEITCPASVLIELRDEVRSLRNSCEASNRKVDILTEEVRQCKKTIRKLTEEVITVKLENRKHHDSNSLRHSTRFDKLPFLLMEELMNFNDELKKDEEFRDEFKNFIAKIGGEGYPQFVRSAIRKVFTDDLASLFSWKGTKEKPSAEKLFVTTLIKNICHMMYEVEDRDLCSILQKHFVHSKERLTKRQRTLSNT